MGGHQRLPYTYVDNCADALVRAATVAGIDGESFNIVDDELPTGAQLIRERRRRVGPIRTVVLPLWALTRLARVYTAYSKYSKGQLPPILTPYRVNASWNSLGYTNIKAKTRLGWNSSMSLDAGIQATLGP
jgi:nucleoside-diphosphate-sugar epimerase